MKLLNSETVLNSFRIQKNRTSPSRLTMDNRLGKGHIPFVGVQMHHEWPCERTRFVLPLEIINTQPLVEVCAGSNLHSANELRLKSDRRFFSCLYNFSGERHWVHVNII